MNYGIITFNYEFITEQPAPVNMLLYCPNCGEQHLDHVKPEQDWDNPPHRSHKCDYCDYIWRPADVPTNGVAAILTKGKMDQSAKPKYYKTAKDFDDAVEYVTKRQA